MPRDENLFLSFRAKRGISLWFALKKGKIPRFARTDERLGFPQAVARAFVL
jgi:hypothetical protein